MGDFNIKAFKTNIEEFKELNNMMISYGLKQSITQTTRYGNSEKCIDHIYSN